ncbi:MAG: aminopeptidase N, partial [Pseudomonadota bacterium]
MAKDTPELIYLKDYKTPAYLIDTVHLDINLDPAKTRFTSKMAIRPARTGEPLKLDIDDIMPSEIRINGTLLKAEEYNAGKKQLVISQVPATAFTLETVTTISPKDNTQLMGLYMSDGIFCTQCEAEGFRRITPFIDRPDVLARYTTRIEGDKTTAPILLANGNRIDGGDLPDGRHFAVWEDPFPKPAYLFALVGGDLGCV